MKKITMLVITTLLALIIGSVACEPFGRPIIQNQTSQDITIFYAHVRTDGTLDQFLNDGTVPAKSTQQVGRHYILR